MTPLEFYAGVRKGRGCAVQFLRTAPDKQPYLWVVTRAIIRNLGHDPMFDSSRAPYLKWLIEASGENAAFRQLIFRATPRARYSADRHQLLDLCELLAREGDGHATAALYQMVANPYSDAPLTGVRHLVRAEGLAGLTHVIEHRLEDLRTDRFEAESIVETYEDAWGKARTGTDLASVRGDARFVEFFKLAKREVRKQAPRPSMQSLTFQQFWAELDNAMAKDAWPTSLAHDWANSARTPGELLEVANAFVKETDDRKLRALAIILTSMEHRFDDVSPVIERMRDAEHREFHLLHRPFEKTPLAEFRQLGLELLDHPERWYLGVDLLATHGDVGDESQLFQTLRRNEGAGAEYIHQAARAPRDWYERGMPTPSEMLLWSFDHTPCAFCRWTFLEPLIDQGAATPELLEECRWDAEKVVRELAEEALTKLS